MKKPDTTDLRRLVVEVIARRARPGKDRAAIVAAARRAYDDLAAVIVPLISQAGFDALAARAFQLARREYPAHAQPHGDGQATEPFVDVSVWLERQDPRDTINAAAAMFEELATLLTTLIGESLTTRYLRKAWPEDFSAPHSKKGQA